MKIIMIKKVIDVPVLIVNYTVKSYFCHIYFISILWFDH